MSFVGTGGYATWWYQVRGELKKKVSKRHAREYSWSFVRVRAHLWGREMPDLVEEEGQE